MYNYEAKPSEKKKKNPHGPREAQITRLVRITRV